VRTKETGQDGFDFDGLFSHLLSLSSGCFKCLSFVMCVVQIIPGSAF